MPSGTLALRLLPDGSAGNYDTLQVTGVANLGGTLKPVAHLLAGRVLLSGRIAK